MAAQSPEAVWIAHLLGEPGSAVRAETPAPQPDADVLGERAVAHGLAPLLQREAASLGIALPDGARARVDQAAAYCAGRAKKCQFTLYRFLAASARRGLDTTLLKGSALVGSVYRDPGLRAMDDIDLLVREQDLPLARAVGEEIGLGASAFALPAFFYELTNFAAPLRPDVETLVPIDLHWRLHSPTLLLTDAIERIWERRVRRSVYGYPTSALDPADQWLHLATHLWSHWGHTPSAAEAPAVEALVAGPGVAVALKWVLDLVRATSELPAQLDAKALAERAAEWSAQAEMAATLALVQPLLAAPGAAFAGEGLRALGADHAAPGRDLVRSKQAGQLADPTLGFRLGTFRRLPGWLFPPARYLRAVAGLPESDGALSLLRLRVVHAVRVGARSAAAAALFPIALLGRRLARRSRERRIRAAKSPTRVMELMRVFREFERAYAERFAAARPERERA